MRYVILTFLLTFSALNGQAQKVWEQEPTSFLGVKFGKPLLVSYPECTNEIENGKRTYKPDGASTCWQHLGNDAILVNAKDFYKLYVQSVNGEVASITASFKHSDFDKIEKNLIAKYGEPQWRNYPTMETKDGRNLPFKGLNWFGKEIQLSCMSQSPNEDEGMLVVDNRVWEKVLERISHE
jgi:hypothetical protein